MVKSGTQLWFGKLRSIKKSSWWKALMAHGGFLENGITYGLLSLCKRDSLM